MKEFTPPETMVTIPSNEGFDPTSTEAEAAVIELTGDFADRCKKVGGCTLNMGVGANEDGSAFIGSHCEPTDKNDTFKGCTVQEDGEASVREQIVAIAKN